MNRIRKASAEIDAFLDRHHCETIIAVFSVGAIAFAWPRKDSSEFIEFAFTLDGIIAAVGLGVLLHLCTRK